MLKTKGLILLNPPNNVLRQVDKSPVELNLVKLGLLDSGYCLTRIARACPLDGPDRIGCAKRRIDVLIILRILWGAIESKRPKVWSITKTIWLKYEILHPPLLSLFSRVMLAVTTSTVHYDNMSLIVHRISTHKVKNRTVGVLFGIEAKIRTDRWQVSQLPNVPIDPFQQHSHSQTKKALSKSKEKKLQRTLANEQAAAVTAHLKSLTENPNPLSDFAALLNFNKNGIDIKVQATSVADVPPCIIDWAFQLTEAHMKPSYEGCSNWGWKPKEKKKELQHEDARYLIAYNNVENASPVAFLHYRYEEEHGQPIVYVYEIQVDTSVQGKGVGAYLMRLIELIARKGKLKRILLTVFHDNVGAYGLYRKLGYVLDDDSPAGEGYDILTKRFE